MKNDGKNAFRFYGETNDSKIKKCTEASIEEITSRLRERENGRIICSRILAILRKIYRFWAKYCKREQRSTMCIVHDR